MSDRRRPPVRTLRRLSVVAALGLLFLLVSLPLFVLPSVDEPEDVRAEPVDAVVVLGGGTGERIAAATSLVRRLPPPAPTMLLSVPYDAPLLECGIVASAPEVDVRCLVPEPLTTSGEAATVTTLASAEGWDRVVVVTSDYHVTRSRLLFTRCVEQQVPDLTVLWVAGETEPLSLRGLWQIATEWPSLLGTPWDHQPPCAGEPAF